ncbi:MAG TPA: hypothetical protein ENF95_01165 [Candidatus Aenigmarchaeota archaeon]|nr:hypothetical protein [Candidatus Aenigmarchaeota archaeon]
MKRCKECGRRIRRKEPFYRFWDTIFAEQFGFHEKVYFHPWCWEKQFNTLSYPFKDLDKRQRWLKKRYVDENPAVVKEREYENLKEAWLNARLKKEVLQNDG